VATDSARVVGIGAGTGVRAVETDSARVVGIGAGTGVGAVETDSARVVGIGAGTGVGAVETGPSVSLGAGVGVEADTCTGPSVGKGTVQFTYIHITKNRATYTQYRK
jgi:hypothetical protein